MRSQYICSSTRGEESAGKIPHQLAPRPARSRHLREVAVVVERHPFPMQPGTRGDWPSKGEQSSCPLKVGTPKGIDTAAAQLLRAFPPYWGIFEVTSGVSDEESVLSKGARKAREPEKGRSWIFIARELVQGNVAFKGVRFMARMPTKPPWQRKAPTSAANVASCNLPKFTPNDVQIWRVPGG